MGNQITYSPDFSSARWPDAVSSGSDLALGPVGTTALQMDPSDVFNYIQQNRARIGLSDQFQAYSEGDTYVLRMGRADVQHLMDAMSGLATAYMQMAQRNPQLLEAMNRRSAYGWPTNASDMGCGCGAGCQCGNCQCPPQNSWNRQAPGDYSRYQSSTNNDYLYSQQAANNDYLYYQRPNNNGYLYQPGYNGYGWSRGGCNGGYGGGGGFSYGGNPLMQSLAYSGGNPQQFMRYAVPSLVSGLVFRGMNGGFGRFRH